MALKQRIQDDVKDAMRARDAQRLGTLRLLTAAIKQREVDGRTELDDAGVIAVIDKMVKQRKDSEAAFIEGNRPDLAAKEAAEMLLLAGYLPQRMDAQQVALTVKNLIAELGASGPGDMGRVMAAAKARLGAGADMAMVSAAVKQALQS